MIIMETKLGYKVLALVKGYSESYETFIHKEDDERILTITYNSNGKAKYTSESD